MIFAFGNCKLDVDVDKTKAYYKTAKTVTGDCSCDGCRNYVEAIDFLPKEVTTFFAQLGIDMKKPREVYSINESAGGTLPYGGWYHVCATIIQGENPVVYTSENQTYSIDETKTFSITDDFKIYFSEKCDLLENDFPRPAIQLEIMVKMPWVLDEEHKL